MLVGVGVGVVGLAVVGKASIQCLYLTILEFLVFFFTFLFLAFKDLRISIADVFFLRFGTAGNDLKFGSNRIYHHFRIFSRLVVT